jgi:transposase
MATGKTTKGTSNRPMAKKTLLSDTELNRRRKRAMQLINAGKSQAEAARSVGVSRQAVSVWVRHYTKAGWSGLRVKPCGRPRSISAAQAKKLKAIIDRGPVSEGYPDGIWTGWRINKIVRRMFGVQTTDETVLNLIRAEGWRIPIRRQRPR